MLSVDERARKLLLNAPKKSADIVIGSGDDTGQIVKDYREAGYAKAMPAAEVLFQQWVAKVSNSVAAGR